MSQQSTKQPKAAPVDRRAAAVRAALALSAQLGWAHVTMADVAQEAGCTLAELHDEFDGKGDILAAYERGVSRRMLAGAAADPSGEPRDALFDLLMDRFEILNEDRAALLSILDGAKSDPKEALLAMPALGRSMAWVLEAAGLGTAGWKGAARIAGLSGLYLAVLRDWIGDDSADLSRTMASLDKQLARAEGWAGRLNI